MVRSPRVGLCKSVGGCPDFRTPRARADLVDRRRRDSLTFFNRETGATPCRFPEVPEASPCPLRMAPPSGGLAIGRGDDAQAAIHYRRALVGGIECLPEAVRSAAREQAAALELRLGNPGRAAELLTGLTSTAARGNHAFALLQLRHPAKALTEFEAVLLESPADRKRPRSGPGASVVPPESGGGSHRGIARLRGPMA